MSSKAANKTANMEEVQALQEELNFWKEEAIKNVSRLVEVIYWYEGDQEKVMEEDEEDEDYEEEDEEDEDYEEEDEEDYEKWAKEDLLHEIQKRCRGTKKELVTLLQRMDGKKENPIKKKEQSWKEFWNESSDEWNGWWKIGWKHLDW